MSKRAAEVLVELILGHRAAIREKPTPEGYTHDWEVYVKAEQGNIQTFVQCVIFTLHESFPNPIRMVNNPPYSVKESGYAGFIVKIEIIFKNKNEPKKAVFHYDLFLQSQGPAINPSRKEKLIFNNPGSELTRKLIKGGGTIVSEVVTEKSSFATPSVGGGSGYHSGGGKSKPATVASAKVSPKNSFENLFGIPIKRSSNAPPTTSSTSVSSSSNPSSALSSKNGSNSKESKSAKSKHDKSSSSKNYVPRVKSPLTPESTICATSSSMSKSSSSTKKEKEVKVKKEKGSSKNMLPPSNTSVPKKAKKSDRFTDDSSPPSSSKHSKSEKSSSKSKRIKSEPLDIKPDISHDSRSYGKKSSSDRDRPSSRGSSEKPPLSPISSSSTSNSSSSCSSPHSSNHTDDESESDQIATVGGMEITHTKKSTNPSSSTSRRRSKNSTSLCISPSSAYTGSTPSPESSTSSSSSLSTDVPSSSSKKRKGSSSGSRSPPSKKIALDKSAPVSSSNSRGEYRESKSSKKKSSKTGIGSSEEVSSAISPDPSHGTTPSSKSSKKHNVIDAPAENSSSSSSRKFKSYSDTSSKHKSAELNHSRHIITAAAISTSSSSRGAKRYRDHDRDGTDTMEQETEPDSDVNSDEIIHSEPSTPSPESVSSDRANENGQVVSSNNNINNGIDNSPGGMLGNPNSGLGFSHAGVAGNITAEMKLLKELHARISTLISDDPNKLQEIVDIVESSGKDCWNTDTGITFDFDLCKLSSTTINRLKQAVL